MTSTTEFPAPLARFVQTDFDGDQTFCYSKLSGHLQAVVQIAEERLSRALGYRGKDRDREVREVLGYLRERAAEQDLINRQWTAHLEERRAARAARPIGEIAARVVDRIPNPAQPVTGEARDRNSGHHRDDERQTGSDVRPLRSTVDPSGSAAVGGE